MPRRELPFRFVTPHRFARPWFAATAFVVALGVVVQLFATYDTTEGFFTGKWERVLNVFVFFTIQSNLMVGFGSAWLALGRATSGLWFRTVRLLGTIAIILTFIVYHAVLRDLQDLTGQAAFADVLLHSVVPLMCVIGWIWFGPRGLVDPINVGMCVGYLLVWGTATLIRGEAVGWYPYAFMDPTDNGYARVAVNLLIVGLVFVAMGFGTQRLDQWLSSRRSAPTAAT